MSDPLVSILIPTCNGEAHLRAALRSAREQSYRDVEIIIGDDASTDRTPEIIAAAAAEDDRIRVIRHETNGGGYDNLQSILEAARGEYVKYLLHDDVLATRLRPRARARPGGDPGRGPRLLPPVAHRPGRPAGGRARVPGAARPPRRDRRAGARDQHARDLHERRRGALHGAVPQGRPAGRHDVGAGRAAHRLPHRREDLAGAAGPGPRLLHPARAEPLPRAPGPELDEPLDDRARRAGLGPPDRLGDPAGVPARTGAASSRVRAGPAARHRAPRLARRRSRLRAGARGPLPQHRGARRVASRSRRRRRRPRRRAALGPGAPARAPGPPRPAAGGVDPALPDRPRGTGAGPRRDESDGAGVP
ncbi:glycosyltransferase family 2 protein [Blastococcus sp. TML/M2B]|nr:glycosyltransferase family 2 protein [Blastococcus sp. TML/M2B]